MPSLAKQEIELLQASLAGFELNDAEFAIYQATFLLPRRPASVIAKAAGLNRAYTYDVLAALLVRGLVREEVKNGVKHFFSVPPEELVEILERREKELAAHRANLSRALPALKNLTVCDDLQPISEYAQGSSEILKLLEQTICPEEKILYALVRTLPAATISGPEWSSWRIKFEKSRIASGVWMKALVSTPALDSELGVYQDRLLEIRAADSPSGVGEIIASGDNLLLLSPEPKRTALLVRNSQMAGAVKLLHGLLWDTSSVRTGPTERRRAHVG
ncbi:MAG: helix-turn-helix domain-containing protein [Bdellovibrionota bacterium]